MKDQELLGHLTDLARRLGYDVRTDQGAFRDGACRLEERKLIILNRASPLHRRAAALSAALGHCSLDGLFLLPAVRQAIAKASGDQTSDDIEQENDAAIDLDDPNYQPSPPQEAAWQNHP